MARKYFQWTIHNVNAPPAASVSPVLPRDAFGRYLVSTPHGIAISPLRLFGADPYGFVYPATISGTPTTDDVTTFTVKSAVGVREMCEIGLNSR